MGKWHGATFNKHIQACCLSLSKSTHSTLAPTVNISMAAVLPSYSTYRQAQQLVRHTEATRRLFWSIQGPLETHVFVLEDFTEPESTREPYLQQSPDGTRWHDISQEPLTEPRVSSVTVGVYQLAMWEEDWLEWHRHAYPGEEGCVYEEVDEGDEDEDGGYEGQKLVRCCGTDRPKETPPLVVRASEHPYVTVHDYLTAVHPWLIGLRRDVLWASNVCEDEPLPAETKLMVNYNAFDRLNIEKESDWIPFKRGGRNLAIDNSAY